MRFYQPSCDCGYVGKRARSQARAEWALERHDCGTLRRRQVSAHVTADLDTAWIRIAKSVSGEWMSRAYGDDYDDVFSDAMLGIVQALKTWKPGGLPLEVHAYRRAKFAIIDGFRLNRGLVSRTEWKNGVRVKDLPKHRLSPISSDAMRDEHDALPIVHVIDIRATDAFDHVDSATELDALLAQLRPHLRRVMVMCDLLGYTQAEIAADLKVTPSRVCQMHKEAMAALRAAANCTTVRPGAGATT